MERQFRGEGTPESACWLRTVGSSSKGEKQMKVVTAYPDGLFNWVDLTTSDQEGAKAFYGGLFGWEAVDMPTPTGPMYTMFRIQGYNVAGGGPLPPDMVAQGIPPYWMSYVKHSDVDSVVAKAAAVGGTVVMPAMDVMEEGRMALIQDPHRGHVRRLGAPKSYGRPIGQHEQHVGLERTRDPDAKTAAAFYATVFGWTYSQDPSGYHTFANDGRVQAWHDGNGRLLGADAAKLVGLFHGGGHPGHRGQGPGIRWEDPFTLYQGW